MTKSKPKIQKKLAKVVLAALMFAGGTQLVIHPSVAEAFTITLENANNPSSAIGGDLGSSGYYFSPKSAECTELKITGGSTETNYAGFQDYYSNGADVKGHTITVDGATVGAVFGGLGFSSANIENNTVNIDSGTVRSVYGGRILSSSHSSAYVNYNTVNIRGGTVNGYVYGGDSYADANYNTVNISGVTVSECVYGGKSEGSGAVTGNSVIIDGGSVSGNFIYGGHSKSGSVTENTVTINNGQGTAVYGGGSSDGEVTKNHVVINSSNFEGQVVGGESQKGNASGNSVEVSNGTFTHIWGGHSNLKDDIGNTVTIAGGTVEYNVLGGISSKGNAHENEVTTKGGTIKGSVYGGRAGGSANENTVNISGNTTVKTEIFGGYSTGDVYYEDSTGNTPSTADGNTINISGSPDLSTSDICGGSAYTSAQNNTLNILTPVTIKGLTGGIIQTTGTVAGNTLNVAAKNVTAGSVNGFQSMNFYLPKEIAKDDTMLTVNGGSATDVKGVTFGVAALSGVNLQKGDTVNLLVNENGLTTDDTLKTADSATLAKAEFLSANSLTTDDKYELSISQKDVNTIIATVDNVTEKKAPEEAVEDIKKSPVETRAGVVTLLNAGADLLVGQGMANAAEAAAEERAGGNNSIAASRAGGFAPFAAMSIGSLRAKSGSHVDTKGIGLNLGFAREIKNKSGKLLVGPVVEYGHGSYDSYQDNGIKADGKSSYWGIGVIAKQTNNNGFYYEGSIRGGCTKSDYSSDNVKPGTRVSYDSNATYWAFHLGAGKLTDIGHGNTLDYYGKYFYSHTGSDSAFLNGANETANFDSVNSHRIRLGARITHALNEKNNIYGGLAWQYEFNGDARATYSVSGEAPSPSVKGSSGMLELGWQVKPGKGPMTIDLGVTGWVGKQRGVTANLQANWTF